MRDLTMNPVAMEKSLDMFYKYGKDYY